MKKFLLLTMMILAGALSSYAIFDKYTLNREDLPEAAREMLDTYFPKAKIGMIKVDKHLLKKTDYDVKLVNGTKIEFSNNGEWTSVDCGKKALPDNLLPKAIARHLASKYSGQKAVSIKKSITSYEVGLDDGVVLKFNALGQFKEVVTIGN